MSKWKTPCGRWADSQGTPEEREIHRIYAEDETRRMREGAKLSHPEIRKLMVAKPLIFPVLE